MTTRRNILTILGVAPFSTPAIAACDVSRTDFDGGDSPGYRLQKYDPERMADALERLAHEVRNCTVNLSRMHISSEVLGQGWLTQTLTFDIEVTHGKKDIETGAHNVPAGQALPHYRHSAMVSKKDFVAKT